MTALSTEARTTLAAALQATGYKIYSVAPAVPVSPSVTIVPDSPWITPRRIGSNLNYEVRFRLLVTINPRKNDRAQVDAETAVDAVLAALPSGFTVSGVGSPTLLDTGAQGTVYSTEIYCSAQMKE